MFTTTLNLSRHSSVRMCFGFLDILWCLFYKYYLLDILWYNMSKKQEHIFMSAQYWRRQWHPTPVLLPGKSYGAWWAAVHGVTKSWTQLSDFTFTFHFHALEKEMAAHSGVLAWRILATGEPGGLPSVGSHRVGHDWSDLAAAILHYVGIPQFAYPFYVLVGFSPVL